MAFFTVIIPTYNRQNFLKIAIESVLGQTFSDYELIIVDDGSKDKTSQLVKSYPNPKIKYIYQPHQGVSAARNKGILNARGEFICFLDSDDRFRQLKLEITYFYIKKYPQYKIFHSEEIWYRNNKLLPQKKYHRKPSGWVFERAIQLCCISISTAAIRKDVFKEVGLFDRDFCVCEDYEFWLRATSKFPVFLIPHYLTIKEGGRDDQQSKKYPALDRFRIRALKKIIETNSLDKEKYSLLLQELKRKCSIYIKGAIKRNKLEEAEYYRKIMGKYV